MQNIALTYYRISVWIMRLAYINLLWVVFSVIGLIVIGLMPSTAAMFAVVRKWVSGDYDIPIFRTFWNSYRTEFLKANLLGYMLLVIGYVLFLDLQFLRAQDNIVYTVFSFIILGLFLIYFMVLLYAFPLFVQYETKIFQYIKWAVVIGITQPIFTLIMAVGVVVSYYIIFKGIPMLSVFYGGSIIAYIMMWGSYQTFLKIQPN